MACENCKKFEGDSTEKFADLVKVFEIIESVSTIMSEDGTAKCKTYQQKIEFSYDEILIPKMRVRFI